MRSPHVSGHTMRAVVLLEDRCQCSDKTSFASHEHLIRNRALSTAPTVPRTSIHDVPTAPAITVDSSGPKPDAHRAQRCAHKIELFSVEFSSTACVSICSTSRCRKPDSHARLTEYNFIVGLQSN